ncbi:MAG: UDP-N-acetylmuramoyl-tripeptide--D-alanyl-D-alanine ligase [Bacteroidales bacterium]|nr:UDP-N-acetylmuramoyl-tripeptide--D-alanyl-D-alanine ligase [Bacteroidales bacterium]
MKIDELYSIYLQHPVISTDTRTIPAQSLFFALKGESFDAHQFVPQALEHGAAFCVIDNPKAYIDQRTILVADVLTTLQQLAQYHRQQLTIPIIAITGTNGKTTTKELVSSVLSEKYKITATKGNFNNHIGVPLTLLSIPNNAEIAIVEMGANHPKEIETLCHIAQPDFGLITNIGRAHLEGFGGVEGVIQTKTELYRHLENVKGFAFVNGDDQLLLHLSERLMKKSYGSTSICDFQGKMEDMNPFLQVSFTFHQKIFTISTHLVGKYNLSNVLAAIAIGLYFQVTPEQIVHAIENYYPDNMRSQIKETERNRLIIDTYNANPTSMNAALDNFFDFSGNKALILGDMLELGSWSKEEHQKIIEKIKNHSMTHVFLVGQQFSSVAVSSGYNTFDHVQELVQYIQNHPISDTLLLIKGSRGMKLEEVLPYL